MRLDLEAIKDRAETVLELATLGLRVLSADTQRSLEDVAELVAEVERLRTLVDESEWDGYSL